MNREEELKKLDEKIKDAEENLGDIELRDAILEKAQFFENLKEFEPAIENYQRALSKTIGVGKKMDIVFSVMKIVLNIKDIDKLKAKIDECKKLLEEGGDWERRNRLKVLKGHNFFVKLWMGHIFVGLRRDLFPYDQGSEKCCYHTTGYHIDI